MGEAIFLFAFGCVNNEQPWYTALMVLICFSLFVQMAEGTSYGIVPFMNPKQLACVSALAGAGGNLGAVIALWCFYKPLGPIDTLLPFKAHAGYVMINALLTATYYWPDKGGMFVGPRPEFVLADNEKAEKEAAKEVEKEPVSHQSRGFEDFGNHVEKRFTEIEG